MTTLPPTADSQTRCWILIGVLDTSNELLENTAEWVQYRKFWHDFADNLLDELGIQDFKS